MREAHDVDFTFQPPECREHLGGQQLFFETEDLPLLDEENQVKGGSLEYTAK